jgi:hypothetical protein
MAYGNYFPVTYQPNYYGQPNPYYQQMQNQAMMQQNQQMQNAQQQSQQMQQPTIQQSGFVLVPSEQEARNYPVAPGNSVTFKDENAPYCYVKTMGFNQLDRPTFERYRLVKEDSPVAAQKAPTSADSAEGSKDTAYALKSDLAEIWSELDALKEKVKAQTERKVTKTKKVVEAEAEDDE